MRLADRAGLQAAWPGIALPMHSYLSACHWTVPLDLEGAVTWLLTPPRVSLICDVRERTVIAVVQVDADTQMAGLAILSPTGAEFAGFDEVLGDLVRIAIDDLAARRCELCLLKCWRRARAAAAGVGFQEEAWYAGACFLRGEWHDLLLAGLMADEWTRR